MKIHQWMALGMLACGSACVPNCSVPVSSDDAGSSGSSGTAHDAGGNHNPADAGGGTSSSSSSRSSSSSSSGGIPDGSVPGTDGGTPPTPDGGNTPDAAVAAHDGGPMSNCDPKALLVYVVDTSNMFSSFDPVALQFHDIGTLNCPAGFLATPFSMGVDRNGFAWVLYNDGSIFKVNPTDASCVATTYVQGQHGEVLFGMGFVADAPGSNVDSLFIAGGAAATAGMGDKTLAILDTASMQVATIGTVHGSPELTGTGDAQLWGFYPDTSPPRVAEIDKASGSENSHFDLPQLAGSGSPQAWAFAFWGGRFWMFLQKAGDFSTSVYSMERQGGTGFTTSIADTGRTIVGAGVSTCAPIIN